jgi:hypothetical protein
MDMKNLLLMLIGLLIFACGGQAIPKIKGVSFVASRGEARQDHIAAVKKIHADYAAVMPFGFIRETGSPEIIFDTDHQWFGETRKGTRQYIEMLQKNNIQVMLKPQLWIWRGQFTGAMAMQNEADWKALEASYERFIISFAELASEMEVPMFCIGTELEKFVEHRPDFWKGLIRKIRATYKGRLTYAANWDEYEKFPFWSELDYIGIDAYFPLSGDKTPSVASLMTAWEPWKEKIAALSKARKRRVLFTEFGYRSADYTARKPWLAERDEGAANMEGQKNAKIAIFDTFWNEEWFAGGFVWKWFIDHDTAGGANDNRFTPQNKPAEKIIETYYSAH